MGKKTITKIDDNQPATKADIRGLQVMLEQSNKRWDIIAGEYLSITEKLDNIQDRLENLENEMSGVKHSLRDIRMDLMVVQSAVKKKVDITRFDDLQKRVKTLEAKKR